MHQMLVLAFILLVHVIWFQADAFQLFAPRPIANLIVPSTSYSPRPTIAKIHRHTQNIHQWRSQKDDSDFSNEDSDSDVQSSHVSLEALESDAANKLVASGESLIDLPEEIKKSFLQYAMSIILGRALPDARDGLKPVHRRILYSMHQLNLSPTSSHRKCARVVGEVLGKYHPHGDVAVYDALVRMAQPFTSNYQLVDGHGNFGSVDADPAAAMRYTECRFTHLATNALLQDIADDTVDFMPNFDGNEMEPKVLPARLPMLLLNGGSGIAVGMATNIPPHNLREVLNACKELVDARIDRSHGGSKQVSDDELLRLVPGPDFPTGASILGTSGSKQLYTTGNGGVVMRAITEIEEITRTKPSSTRVAIVVKELPYQVNKAALLEKVASLVNDKQIDGIADLRDESDRDGIRVVLELKRDAMPDTVLNNLYKKTPLQTTFSGNFLALFGNKDNDAALTPKRFTLREALDCFLDFRFSTIRRKSAFHLSKVEGRMHVVEGLLKALKKVDEVIELIRKSSDQAAVRAELENPNGLLGLSKDQADSVLRLQLGQLTKLNQDKLTTELEELKSKQVDLDKILKQEDVVYETMLEEFDEMNQRFGRARKTQILSEKGDVVETDMIANDRSVIVITSGGYIKRMPLSTFENQRRGTRGKRGTSASGVATGDDEVAHVVTCNDHDTLLMITKGGLAYSMRAYQVPIASRTAKGAPIPTVLQADIDQDVTSVLPVSEFREDEYIVLATEQSWIKRTPLDRFSWISKRGLKIMDVGSADKLRWSQECQEGNDIMVASSKGMVTRYETENIHQTGRTSMGARAMKLKDGDKIADMSVLQADSIPEDEFVLFLTSQGYGKRVSTDEFRATDRGLVGVTGIKFRKEVDRLSSCRIVKEDDEVLISTAKGIMVRQRVSQIPVQSRSAMGVVVQKLDKGDRITNVCVIPKNE